MKKVILFGAGAYGKQFIEKNSDFVHDNFLFCDNNPNKWGNVISGIETVSLCEVKQLYKNGEIGRIIITTARVGEIFEQCIQERIAEQNIYFYEITTNAVKAAREAYAVSVFSQDGEETYLRDFFGDKKDGFYIDVGAYDPFRFSNTAWAYERGWKGINIEPNIKGYRKFVQMRKRDINLNCGISEEERSIPYFEFDEGAYNTFCQEEIPDNLEIKRVNKIATRRLDRVLDEYSVNHIDFLDIDVEGYELSVLSSNNWNLYRPTIVLIEQRTKMEDILKSDVYSFMKDKGYTAVGKYNRTVIYQESSNEKK